MENKINKKGQSSLEFLMILGIGLTISVILGGIFFNYAGESKSGLDKKQINNLAETLMDNINKIYYAGSGNKFTMKSTFPENIINFTIEHVNVTDPSTPGERLYYDYLNITFESNALRTSHIFLTGDTYIRFNCTRCYNTIKINGEWTSYFNQSDFSQGVKTISIQNKGEWVSIDFKH